jgi:hypothetical protein
MYRNILKIITVFFVMLALIVPVTLEKLPAINEKYDMAKALEDNVLQPMYSGIFTRQKKVNLTGAAIWM